MGPGCRFMRVVFPSQEELPEVVACVLSSTRVDSLQQVLLNNKNKNKNNVLVLVLVLPHSNRICRSVERSKLDRCDAFAGARGQAPRGPPGGTTKQQRPPGLVDTNRTTTTPHHRYCTPSWSQARSFSILQRQSSKVYMCRNLNPRTNRSRMSRPIRSRRKRTIITPTILCRTVSDADTSRIVESIYLLIYLDKKVWRPLKLNDRVQVLLAVVKPLVDVSNKHPHLLIH